MGKVIKRNISLYKVKADNLSNDAARTEVVRIVQRFMTETRTARGWSAIVPPIKDIEPQEGTGFKFYNIKVHLICRPIRNRSDDAISNEVAAIAECAAKSGSKIGWQISAIDGDKRELQEPDKIHTGKATTYCDIAIPDNWKENFSHVFERDAQIEVTMSAISAGIKSEWDDRLHCALVGPPACGKSEILRSIRTMFGEVAVMEFDATATTQAGAIKNLAEREIMPRILLVEEIEKVEENALRWLLGILDFRAEIRKTNFRQNITKEVKLICLATVNDWKCFNNMMSGALASRFVNKIYCPRPNRTLLEKILARDVGRLSDGNLAWIKPALDYAEANQISDPREVLSILKCGRNDLLTGAHQKRLQETSISNYSQTEK